MNATKGVKIRTFENNSKTVISIANDFIIDRGSSDLNLKSRISSTLFDTREQPTGATYEYDDTTHKLTCTLPANSYGAATNYVIIFDTKTISVTQTPNPLPSGATDISF